MRFQQIIVYGLLAIAIAMMLGTNTILAFESPINNSPVPTPEITPPYDLPWCGEVPAGACFGSLPTPTPAPTPTTQALPTIMTYDTEDVQKEEKKEAAPLPPEPLCYGIGHWGQIICVP